MDDARDGFIAALEEAGFKEGEDVVYDLQNAQGDLTNAISIAQKFKDDKVNLIVAIATLTAQAALQVNKEIPIVINAVTDPVAANLAQSWESSGNNLTGMSDAAPNKQQIELIPRFLPKTKNVGTIYNAGEVNSVVQIGVAKEVCEELGLKLIEVTVSNSSEVLMVTHNMKQALDVGNRTVMMDRGHNIFDIQGKERKKITVDNLIRKFSLLGNRKDKYVEDRMVLI